MKISPNVWTQLNTSSNSFVIQNLSMDKILLIASVEIPQTNTPDLVLDVQDVISSIIINKIFWGKPSREREALVGIVE